MDQVISNIRRSISSSRAIARTEAYKQNGDLALLTDAVKRLRAVAESTRAGHPDRARHLNNLCLALRMLAEASGDRLLAAEAVRTGQEAVGLASPVQMAGIQNNLGGSFRMLFELTKDEDALAGAVAAARSAVASTAPGTREVAQHLANLALVLRLAAEHTGDRATLASSLEAGREAVAACDDRHPERGGILLNMASSLGVMFRWTGDESVLAEAVQAARSAVAAIADGRPERAAALANLAGVLDAEFGRTGDSALVAEAVDALRAAAAILPRTDFKRPALLNNLGIALLSTFFRTGSDDALVSAVESLRQAVALLPAGRRRARYLSSLSRALAVLGEHNTDYALLAESVRAARAALAATSASDANRVRLLDGLAVALLAAHKAVPDSSMVEEAVQAEREAVLAGAADPSARIGALMNLGLALRQAAVRTDPMDIAALAEAASCYAEVAGDPSIWAMTRLTACQWLMSLTGVANVSPADGLSAAETAVSLLPQVASRGLVRIDREYQLSQRTSLAGEVAAAAVAAGRPERAVELLEQARGVLVAETIDTRTSDLGRLGDLQPTLAEELRGLRRRLDQLDSVIPVSSSARDLARASRERRTVSADWESLLAKIRALDGFAEFLLPRDIRDLAACATEGPVVIPYASPSRCDALIVSADNRAPVRLVPLPHLTYSAVESNAKRLREAVWVTSEQGPGHRTLLEAQRAIRAILEWEWDSIAAPVLRELRYMARPQDGHIWPRLWWCPVGALASLPLHAAGYHHGNDESGSGGPRAVLDLVISSYTTTLRALIDARNREQVNALGSPLVITAPRIPGAAPLTGVAGEAQALIRLLPGATVLKEPTRDAVLAALPGHPMTHFGCHGILNVDNPAASQLLLHDYEVAPLTLADISSLRLAGTLAYLSACDTAVTAPRLANESLHLTGAFQLAGYTHVIGTLWPVSDAAAKRLAIDFYNDLTSRGATIPKPLPAAKALHHSTRRLRERYRDYPALWAGHIHTGT
jgi:CHAT domain-containing protein